MGPGLLGWGDCIDCIDCSECVRCFAFSNCTPPKGFRDSGETRGDNIDCTDCIACVNELWRECLSPGVIALTVLTASNIDCIACVKHQRP